MPEENTTEQEGERAAAESRSYVKMHRPLVLALAAAVAAAAIAGTVLRRPAHHATAAAVVAVRPMATAAGASAPSATASPAPRVTLTPVPATPASRPLAARTPASAVTAAATPTPLPAQSHPVIVQTNVPVLQTAPAGDGPRLAAEEPPKIIAVAISNQTVSAGQMVNGHVETSSNVASVEASVAGYVAPLEKTGVGHFTLAYRVPQLPFFLRHRTYSITVTAHNVRGESAQTSVPITIQ